MNRTLNPKKVAVATGLFIGGWHVIWSLLVLLGIGQFVYDFILWAHMIQMPIVIGPFNALASVVLILLTFVMGCVFGGAFALIWNRLHREV